MEKDAEKKGKDLLYPILCLQILPNGIKSWEIPTGKIIQQK